MADQDRARVLAGAARFRAKRLAKRIKSYARARTPVDTGRLRDGWRCRRYFGGVWEVYNDVRYAQYVDGLEGALAKASNKYLPAVHVNAVSGIDEFSVLIVPWTQGEILQFDCRPSKGVVVV